MVTELIRPVNYNPGIRQKLIKFEISSFRCSQLECNDESGETEGYSALYIPLLPLMFCTSTCINKNNKLLLVYQQISMTSYILTVGTGSFDGLKQSGQTNLVRQVNIPVYSMSTISSRLIEGFFLFDLILYVQVNNFSVISGRVSMC